MRVFTLSVVVFSILFGSGSALAGDIYINGHKLNNLKDTTFTGCTVVFDSNGNIQITAPGYQIVREGEQPEVSQQQPAPVDELKYQYFIYSTTNSVGLVPFMFSLWINGKKVLDVDVTKSQTAVEITKHLRRGANSLKLEARHHAGGSGNAAHEFLVAVGKGKAQEGMLEITQQIAQMSRKGNDANSGVKEFHIDAE